MTGLRQEALQIQCTTDALRKGGPFVSKTKNIIRNLRAVG